MSAAQYSFIEPLDVLYLRGNKLFGDPGSYGESLIPPWPSVAAGAVRSKMLADDSVDLRAFASGHVNHPYLGTPDQPGSFVLQGFYVARKQNGKASIVVAPPADLVVSRTEIGQLRLQRLIPQPIDLASSFPLPELPVLTQQERTKPESGLWLTQAGWQAYLQGRTPDADQLLRASDLWALDSRIGIGMDAVTRTVEQGKLFSAQAVAMKPNTGFLIATSGCQPPVSGLLRFGGDGRAAHISPVQMELPQPDYEAICTARRCRIVLTSPGLFVEGWKLTGANLASSFCLGGVRARLVSACVPRAETVSGWDLAKGQPKAAQRVAPTGSVYWLDELEATPAALRKLAETGLWSDPCEDMSRRAEGFNQFTFAAY